MDVSCTSSQLWVAGPSSPCPHGEWTFTKVIPRCLRQISLRNKARSTKATWESWWGSRIATLTMLAKVGTAAQTGCERSCISKRFRSAHLFAYMIICWKILSSAYTAGQFNRNFLSGRRKLCYSKYWLKTKAQKSQGHDFFHISTPCFDESCNQATDSAGFIYKVYAV